MTLYHFVLYTLNVTSLCPGQEAAAAALLRLGSQEFLSTNPRCMALQWGKDRIKHNGRINISENIL